MGAWDTGPLDNDTALDYELGIFEPKDPDEQRYVAWLVTQLKPDFRNLQEHVALSLKRMKALLENDEWLENWKNPEKAKKSVQKQIEALEATISLIELDI